MKFKNNVMNKIILLKITFSVSVELDRTSILFLIFLTFMAFFLLLICIKDPRIKKYDFLGDKGKKIKVFLMAS